MLKKQPILTWDEEIKFWQSYSKIYHHLEKAGPYRALVNVVRNFIDPHPDSIWLDAGCGSLKMSEIIWQKSEKKVKQIVAVDIVLDAALRELSVTNDEFPIYLIQANLGFSLPFKEETFDGIVANLVLPYISSFEGMKGKRALQGVLGEMYRILKPGGQIVWSTPRQNVSFFWVFLASLPDIFNIIAYLKNPEEVLRIYYSIAILQHALTIQKMGKIGYYTFLPVEEIKEIMTKVGFTCLQFQRTFAMQVWVVKGIKPYFDENKDLRDH